MKMLASILFSLLLVCVANAQHSPRNSAGRRRHHAKRQNGGDATFYQVGLGACGNYNSDSEMVVALNAPQWDGGAHCGQSLTISFGGKTASATVVDLCPGCAHGSLDMSPSLFEKFNHKDVGRFQMSWSWNDGSGGGSSGGDSGGDKGGESSQKQEETSTWEEPKPSSKKEEPAPPSSTWSPEPTSTWTPEPSPSPTSTSTWTPEPSSSSSEAPSSSQSPSPSPSSSAAASSTSSTSSAAPSSSASPSSSAAPATSASSSSTLASSSTSANATTASSSSSLSSSSSQGSTSTRLPDVSAETPNDSVVSQGEGEDGNLAKVSELVVSLGRLIVAGVA